MPNAIEEYIKLADGATEGPWKKGSRHDGEFIESNMPSGVVQKGDGSHFVASVTANSANPNYDDAVFIAASRTLGPAMAKALLEAEEALKMSSGTGTHSATRIVVDQALAAIQHVKEGV